MKFRLFLPLSLLVAALSGCASEPALTPSELNAHADQYNGKKVRARGWLVVSFEEYALWDSKEAYGRPSAPGQFPNECVSYLGPINHRTSGKVAILEGTFWRDFATSLNVIDLGTCNISGLDVDNDPPAIQRKSN